VRERTLITLAVLAVWMVTPASHCPAATSTKPAPDPSGGNKLSEPKLQRQRPPLVLRDSTGTDRPVAPGPRYQSLWRTLAYSLVVLGLGAVLVLLIKKVLPKIGVAIPGGKRISVIETAHLGSKKTMYLVRVGGRDLLLGTSRDGIAMLADVTQALDESPRTQDADGEHPDGED